MIRLNKNFIPSIYNVPGDDSKSADIDQCYLESGFDADFQLFPVLEPSAPAGPHKVHVNIKKGCVERKSENHRHIWPYILEASFQNMGQRPLCKAGLEFSCDLRDLFRLWFGLPMNIESFQDVHDRKEGLTLDKILQDCDGSPIFIVLRYEDGYEVALIIETKNAEGDYWEYQSSDVEGHKRLDAKQIQDIYDDYGRSEEQKWKAADIVYGRGPAALQMD